MKGLNVQLPVQIVKQGKYFVVYSPALDITTSGKTLSEVRKRFNEIVGIFFNELIEAGTLHDVLTELGWSQRSVNTAWQPPKTQSNSFDVKIPVMA